MKLKSFFLNLTFILLSTAVFSQAGTLDDTFGDDGIVLYNYAEDHHDNAFDIHVYDDNSMIVAGTHMDFSYTSISVLQKFLPDGSIDESWGSGGMVEFTAGVESHPRSMIVQDDGKILVSGVSYPSATNTEFFAARFNPDGTPDESFNEDGQWISSYSESEEDCDAMAVQDDGKILLGGNSGTDPVNLLFTRLHVDGTVDESFGTDGFRLINNSTMGANIYDIDILSNGDIVAMGYAYEGAPLYGNQAIMIKLDSEGNPAEGFGTDGLLIPEIFTDVSVVYSFVLDGDYLVATGHVYDEDNNTQPYLTRIDADGIADPSFGDNGMTTLSVDPLSVGYDLIKGHDGKYYASGTAGLGGMNNRDFLLVRWNADGTVDTDFNGTGYVKTDVRPDWDEANALAMQADGNIVLAGFSSGINTSGDNDRVLTRYVNDFVPVPFSADFEGTPNTACVGNAIQFTDMSEGEYSSREWTFEGGMPGTSTAQNPEVNYLAPGSYDVKLVISDGEQQDSLIKTDYIQVSGAPAQASQPEGPEDICQNANAEYLINSVAGATSYEWQVIPEDAGTITGTDTIGAFESSQQWSGSYAVKVRAINTCGEGEWSEELTCQINPGPSVFQITGDGNYCQGDEGAELLLDGSELDVEYELYLDDVATGTIVTGTGESVSFGYQHEEGLYTAKAIHDGCSQNMEGEVTVQQNQPPEQPEVPAGVEQVCNDEVTAYTVAEASGVSVYQWALDPAEAGIVNHEHDSIAVTWADDFSGNASLTVSAENNCGMSIISNPLNISVNASPEPAIEGLQDVCNEEQTDYQTAEQDGSDYVWQVTGGSIVSGEGTNAITVEWGDFGIGYISVSQTNSGGCETTTEDYEVTINNCSSIGESDLPSIKVYPNPATDKIFLESASTNDLKVEMMDAVGQTIKKIDIPSGTEKFVINTGTYTSGVYFLKMRQNKQTILHKVILK